MTAIACILFTLGLLIWTGGNLIFLAVVFRHSSGWFFGCLLIPFVESAYFLFYPKQTWKPFSIAMAGMLITGAGCWLGNFDLLK
jgi:hypothetical protein